MPFPGKSHRVEEHHAEHLIDLDKEGFHAFIKYLVRRADIEEGSFNLSFIYYLCIKVDREFDIGNDLSISVEYVRFVGILSEN